MRCCSAALRCARAPPAHPGDRRARRFRCPAALGSWTRGHRRAINSRLRSSRPSLKPSVTSGIADRRRRQGRASSRHGAGGCARLAGNAIAAPAVDDESQIRLADFGAVETQGALAARFARGIPDAHALRREIPADAGSNSHTPQTLSSRSDARLNANTRRSQSASGRGRRAKRSAMHRPPVPARTPCAPPATLAIAAPITPAPTMITSKSRRRALLIASATPRASFGDACAAAAGAQPGQRRLRRRQQVEGQQPEHCAARRTSASGLANSAHQTVGECDHAVGDRRHASRRTRPAELRGSRRRRLGSWRARQSVRPGSPRRAAPD